jgi:glycosyltransferase involved in cell wall biosynthesis
LKVLFLNPTAEIGGAERSLLELLVGLDRQQVEPFLSCTVEGPLPQVARHAGFQVSIDPWPAFALRIGRRSSASRLLLPAAALAVIPHVLKIAGRVRRERISIIHTNGIKCHVIGSLVRMLTGVHLLWHFRDVLRPGLMRSIYIRLARLTVSGIIANSKTVARSLTGFPGERLHVVYNGFDTDKYAPGHRSQEFRASFGLTREHFLIGAMGALAPIKGWDHLIRAMPAILRSAPEARLIIVGKEMYLTAGHQGHKEELEAEARRLGVESAVIFAGYHPEPVEVLRGLDVLAHTSVYPESFGRVVAEAMACRVPVVATALGGPTEIISAPDQGLLVPPGDPAAIAEAVLKLHRNPELRSAMGDSGRRRVESAFTLEKYVRGITGVYGTLDASGSL